MQYLGEERTFKVVDVKPVLDYSHQNDDIKLSRNLEEDLAKLSLNEHGGFSNGDTLPTLVDFDIFKISARTEFKISTEVSGVELSNKPCYPRLLDVGGLEKQIQLLLDLVLHPLETASKRKGRKKIYA